ncbi:hypothetical protein GYH30_049328 [Glycine max]|uniref:Uncharacterized protein n=1 Tax=Glycine max TaxID=3847 RepID=A0A0R0F8W9_SOYBN|nr:hypothetical protein GYH30_049328 [Glycine max]
MQDTSPHSPAAGSLEPYYCYSWVRYHNNRVSLGTHCPWWALRSSFLFNNQFKLFWPLTHGSSFRRSTLHH